MKLYVYLLEGKDLLAEKDIHVKLKVGKSKSKTRVLMNTRNPIWKEEEFVFKIDDFDKQRLIVSVHQYVDDESSTSAGGFLHKLNGDDLMGSVKIPLCSIDFEENYNLPPTWFSLEKHKAWKSIQKDCGKILLALSLHGKGEEYISLSHNHLNNNTNNNSNSSSDTDNSTVRSSKNNHEPKYLDNSMVRPSKNNQEPNHLDNSMVRPSKNNQEPKHVDNSMIRSSKNNQEPKHLDNSTVRSSKNNQEPKHLLKSMITGRFDKLFKKQDETTLSTTTDTILSDVSPSFSDNEEEEANMNYSNSSFQEMLDEMIQSFKKKDENEGSDNLEGGILVDMTYSITPKDLNALLFGPKSRFSKELAELQGSTDIVQCPWTYDDRSCLTRTITYTKPASKLVKAVKAIEEQTYMKASDVEFDVLAETSTPDVPYGNTFKVNVLYKMWLDRVEPDFEEEATRLVISWTIHFHQNTMMKSMIETGAKQGLKESFDRFAKLLAENVRVINRRVDKGVDKGSVLSTLEAENGSNWDLGMKYFCNWTVISSVLMGFYVFLHILFYGEKREPKGLEFYGVDLPNSFGQVITIGVLAIQMQRVFYLITHFVGAILQTRSDHGVKAQGEGWVLTVALIEGLNLISSQSPDGSSMADPYVVMTCNGKSRTSSVKLQTANPDWNEIFEFDASEEPPSILYVEVFDFEGPFGKAISLGNVEINFLKHSSTQLRDIWVPLEGNPIQPKLHLRVFLDDTNGVDTIKDYLNRMEKEVGKKLNLRSPHSNSSFQKLFGLPPEEFLIKDFLCSLRRKMPLQGRLFLSARIMGFYTNLFGHKTKFYFLWEDIEDIHMLPPSLGSIGSPTLVIILHKDHGIDAKHGAKSQDEEGRLHFYFHSFIYFNEATRTIMVLWKSKSQPLNEKDQISNQIDEDDKTALIDDTCPYVIVEDVKLSQVLSIKLGVNINQLMLIFDGGEMEHNVMSKMGCLNYITTSWQQVNNNNNDDIDMERHISYKFNRFISIFGGEVTCIQHKTPMPNEEGWILNEIMTIHNVPFGDYFRVNLKYEIVGPYDSNGLCHCCVYVGVKWLKNTKFEDRITKNILWMFTRFCKKIFISAEKEILAVAIDEQ